MKNSYWLYIGLLLSLLVMVLICGPHSCEWGNGVYFGFAVVATFAAAYDESATAGFSLIDGLVASGWTIIAPNSGAW